MPETIADYFSRYKKIGRKKHSKEIKIALLSSSTISGVKETLSIKLDALHCGLQFYQGGYNQYVQEILNEKSGLYSFNPQIAILFIDYQSIAANLFFTPYSLSQKDRQQFADEKIAEILELIKKLKSRLSGKILLHNFMVPSYSPLGILESKEQLGHIEMVQSMNSKLREQFKNDSQVFLFDYESFSSLIGKKSITDSRMYYIGDMKLSMEHIPQLCDEYLSYIKPLLSLSKKCIVLDLDNTLWGGIIGEDGLQGIALGPTPQGRPFMEFQQSLLALSQRGIILAINSKNNESDAKEVLEKHPSMVLKEKHFAAMQINWNDKASNMKKIAQELNIGLDSLVFIDDDKANRELIKKQLPEVLVIDMPDDPALYCDTLRKINDLNTLQITDEDKKKGTMYAQQRQRAAFETSATNLDDYLKGLQMKITIAKASSANISRIAQLTQKTNQFNMTTKRYTEQDLTKLMKTHLIFCVRVEDKFGDNGIVGAAITEKNTARIDTFLLSCRVIGRKVEESMLWHIANEMKKQKAKKLTAEFIPTKKNTVAKDFYRQSGMRLIERKDGKERWSLSLDGEFKQPKLIKVQFT